LREREPALYVWGARQSGRTHLLKGAISALAGRGLRVAYADAPTRVPDTADALDAIAVDDVDRLTPEGEAALFNIYNSLRERGGLVLAAGNAPPSELRLRADLVTRLAWGLVYQVHALSDDDKARVLAQHAASRGFDIEPDVATYLLNRIPRDMATLLALVDSLDRFSLEMKRPVTLSLVRELLKGSGS
jgi:DnaA family protein